MSGVKIKPQFIEIDRKKRLVVLTEDEYDRLLDEIDNLVAERVECDESDPLIPWEEVRGKLVDNRIAEARKAGRITRKELAKRMKVKPSTINSLEKKDARPPLKTLEKVAKALNCNVEDLI